MSELIPFRKGNKWGYVDLEQTTIIDFIFDYADIFSEDRAAVLLNDKWGIIDKLGNKITEIKYENITDFKNGFAQVKLNEKWGYINKDGEECIPLIYDYNREFSGNRAAVRIDNKVGFIDEKGNQITGLIYEDCDSFENGIASVQKGGLHGCIDLNGNEFFQCESEIIVKFSEELAAISFLKNSVLNQTAEKYKNYNPGVLTGYEKNGELHLKDKFGNIYDKNVISLNSKNHSSGYINTNGEIVIPLQFDMAFEFNEGVACVCINNNFGYIDKKGSWVIKPVFKDAGDFKNGLARVFNGEKWGFIDKKGAIIIDFKYDEVTDFKENFSIITKKVGFRDEINGLLDLNGNESFFKEKDFFNYDETLNDYTIKLLPETLNENKIAGFVYEWMSDLFYLTVNGKLVSNDKYKECSTFKNGIAKVEYTNSKNEIYIGYIDKEGNEYWEEDIEVDEKVNSVVIGNQEWSKVNLGVKYFRNGDPIKLAQTEEEWEECGEKGIPAYCINDRLVENIEMHGLLYNWYAVHDQRGLAPEGWKIPSEYDWWKLFKYLGPLPRINNKLKSDVYWDGENSTYFGALKSGERIGPNFTDCWQFCMDDSAAWWVSSENLEEKNGIHLCLHDGISGPSFFNTEKNQGYSVRIIKLKV